MGNIANYALANKNCTTLFDKILLIFSDWVFTFDIPSCMIAFEQSRKRRVKCHRDGEFARRTKESFFHDAVTAPAVAYGIPSFM